MNARTDTINANASAVSTKKAILQAAAAKAEALAAAFRRVPVSELDAYLPDILADLDALCHHIAPLAPVAEEPATPKAAPKR